MYNTFNSFLLRTPNFSFNTLVEETFESIVLSSYFQESIYLASPNLYYELQKYLGNEIENEEDKSRIKWTLYRYMIRMSTRSTPFGLFAGISIGNIDLNETKIVLRDFKRHTRFDMCFLSTISNELLKLPEVKSCVKFYSNTTLYKIGKQYRYYEFKDSLVERKYQIVSFASSVYIDAILRKASAGINLTDLLEYLIGNDIEYSNALEFVDDLIDAQILVSELSPTITGENFFMKIVRLLKNISVCEPILLVFNELNELIAKLDATQNNHIELYQLIIRKIKDLGIPYNENYLFQVDTTRDIDDSKLGQNIVKELKCVMELFNKITFKYENNILSHFVEEFCKRYGDMKIPLLEALDPEIGLGYPVQKSLINNSPLLKGFDIPCTGEYIADFKLNKFQSILLNKILNAYKLNVDEIIIEDNDLKEFSTEWDDLPSTIYTMFNVISAEPDNFLIYVNGFYGVSGAKTFTRFAHENIRINQFVHEIMVQEQNLQSSVILAELVHLPNARIGNVLSYPHIREYEIPCCINSDLTESKIISLSDLLLSVRDGKIYLYSKKMKKEIVPRLTNAYNCNRSSIPIFRFLCDIQMQKGRTVLFFDCGILNEKLNYIPRIKYKNTILSLATWRVKVSDIEYLFELVDDNSLIREIQKWRNENGVPENVLLVDSDNELLVNWKNILNVRALISIIKKRQLVVFKEFLYSSEHAAVKDKNGNVYTNECVVVFYKSNEI